MHEPPTPSAAEEQARWRHTAERWRLMYGRADSDHEARLRAAVGPQRAAAWKPLDRSSNISKVIWSRLAALYHDEPQISGVHPEVVEAVAESGYWSWMQRLQRDVLAFRESIALCDLDEDGDPVATVIWPHRARVEVAPRRPGDIVAVHWWEPDPRDPEDAWVEYHIDPRIPRYWATDTKGRDITSEVIERPEVYPWTYRGAPIQPAVMYHAARTGQTWDAYEGIEVHEGAFTIARQYTHFGHVIRHSAHAQRYMVNARARNAEAGPDGTTSQVVADSATVLDLAVDSDDGATNAQIGQWTASVDPEKMIASIRANEKRMVEQALGGVEITRQSSDIRSGYSLAVGREAQILAQEEYAPVFRHSDRQALKVYSALLAEHRDRDYPVSWPTRTGGERVTMSGSTRPEYDIEYSIPGGVSSSPTNEGTP